MRRLLFAAILALALNPLAFAKTKKIHGYVTNIVGPTVFEIEDYRITRDTALQLEFEEGDSQESIQFQPKDIRVGTELEIQGEYDETTGELHAKSIKVFLEEHKKIKRTALILSPPRLDRSGDSWIGTFFADGQRIRVEPSTRVLFKPTKSEKRALKEREKAGRKAGSNQERLGPTDDQDKEKEQDLRPLESLDQVGPNTFMTYEGFRQEDGSIAAVRVEFMRNELEKGEAKMWKQLTPKIKPADYARRKPGELKISRVGKFKLVPNQEAQEYVRQLGESLVPAYQRTLPAGSPGKIPFSFYLVAGKAPNAFALANGTVVVFAPMFDVLENESQLAAVFAHEISHSVDEHTLRQLQYHKKKLIALRIGAVVAAGFGAYAIADIANLIEAAVRNGYSRSLENQADRAALEYMLAAGYDIREAPRVWRAMAKKYGDRPTNFFWSSHDNHTTRRSYLMAELRNNYADTDYTKLRKSEEEFQRVAEFVRESSQKKEKMKVKY